MDLQIKHDIENNIFSTVITIAGLGTEVFSEEEENEMLQNFPSKIVYKNLDFSGNIIMNGTVPEVTEEKPSEPSEPNASDKTEDADVTEVTDITEVANNSIVTVTLPPLSNKEILLDRNFRAEYKIDVNKVPNSAVDKNVLTTKELVAYAYCAIYDKVICDAITKIMDNIRSKAPAFEGETIINI